jgi:uroporphyrinogen-III synthase
MTRRCVLVTRPAGQEAGWLEGLHARGWPARHVPLLAVDDALDPSSLHAARATLRATSPPAAVMFVSPTAVERFFAGEPLAWPESTRAVATGPGTARSLQAAGVAAACIVQPPADAPAFDSEHVWPELAQQAWHGREVWIVRGDAGRDWLAERWQAAGATVHRATAYRRVEPVWTADQRAAVAAASARPAEHAWLLSSSEGARHLAARAPEALHAVAVATHPAIAEAARSAGFAEVHAASPAVDAVIACLESITLR